MRRFAALVLLIALACAEDRGYFMHITDTHVQLDYKVKSDPSTGCWKGSGSAGKYGDYSCRSPYIVHKSGFDYVANLGKKIDFVLWTGDTTAELGGEYTEDGIKTMLKNKTALFKSFQEKTGAKIYPMLGNHDSVPQHHCTETDWWAYEVAADLWKEFLSEESYKSYKKYARYVEDVNDKLRLIVMNSVLYYHHNAKVSESTADPAGQFAWVKEQLAKAKADGKMVYVAGHIPPGRLRDGIVHTWTDKFVDVFNGYHDIIKGSYWGHFHADIFHFIGNVTANDFHTSFQAGNVGSDNKHNPSFRVFEYERTNGDVLDFTQYYFNVKTANSEDKTTWAKRYTATEFYGIPDCKPASMYKAWGKLKADNDLFKKMYVNLWGGYSHDSSNDNRKKKLCFMIAPHLDEYNDCLDTMK